MTVTNIWHFVISILLSILIGVILFWIFLFLFSALFPPVTADGKHTTMPIGQMLSSLSVSIILGLFFMVIIFRKLKRQVK